MTTHPQLTPEQAAARRRRRWRRAGVAALMLASVVAVVPGCLSTGLPAQPLPAGPFLDMHCHVAGVGAGDSGCFVSPDLRGSYKYRIYLRAFGVNEADLLREGDAMLFARVSALVAASEHVGSAVILALDAVVTETGAEDWERTEVYVPGAFVAREVAKYPNLYYGASINPLRPDAIERLRQAKADGAVLVKWLPAIMHFDPADERFRPFYQELKALNLPLLVHTGSERSFTRAEDEMGDPHRLRLALEEGVTVIAAHVATTGKNEGQDNMLRLLEMMPQYPNLYADISSLTQLNKLFFMGRLLRQPLGHERLLYGTDYPLVATPLVSPFYYALQLNWATLWRLHRLANPWDRDVALKQALGLPPGTFTRSAELLGINPAGKTTPQ
jgi:uncharacterized protein